MRDKVKRFISILMTALMLVNLLPVGALAEGVTISNSVQSRAQKRSADVYVYVKVTGDTTGLTQNSSGWFTLGKASDVDGMGNPTYKTPRRYSYDEVGVSYGEVLKKLNHQYNKSIVLRNVNWDQNAGDEAGFVIANGANGDGDNTFVGPGTKTWHLNGYIYIKDVEVKYYIHHVDGNKKDLVDPEERKGKVGHQVGEVTSKTIPGYKFTGKIEKPDKLTLNEGANDVYVYYEPDEKQTVRVTYSAEAGGYVSETVGVNTQTIHKDIQVVTGQTLTDITAVPKPGYEFEGWYKKGSDGRRLDCGATLTADIALRNLDKEKGLYKNTEYHAKFKKAQNLSYTVNYIDKGTNTLLDTKTVEDQTFGTVIKSSDKVIDIDGYNYDSVDKDTLTIGTGDDNVINIYYTKRNDLSYTVNYIDKGTNTLLDTKTVEDQTFGTVIKSSDKVIDIDGYNYDSVDKDTLTIGTGDDNVINIYYTKRNDLSYTVNYYWNGTTEKVTESKTIGGKMFGEEFTESPVGVEGYTPVSTKSQTITLGTGNNEINFHYYKNVELIANSDEKTYDGKPKSVSGYTSAVAEVQEDGTVEYVPWTGEPLTFEFVGAFGSGTDAGDHEVTFKEGSLGENNGLYYVKKVQPGTLTITPAPITLRAPSASKTYDGKPLKAEDYGYGYEGNTDLANDFKSISVDGSQTMVGSSASSVTYELKQGKIPNNYNIQCIPGTLTITPVMDEVLVKIKGNTANVTYDGKLHSVEGYAVDSISNSLYKDSDFTYNGDAKAEGTDAGEYPMNLAETRFENKNTNFANVRFDVEPDGKLTISKRNVTLTSADLTKVYDGTALTNGNTPVKEEFGTEKAFPDGEGLDYTFTGSQTVVGSSDNKFTYKPNTNTKLTNYEITKTEGTLEVTPVTDKVTVTIKGGKSSVTYNGEDHTVTGYKVADISNPLYKEANFTFSGKAEANGKNAGIYKMGLKAADFANTSNNFTNVEFVVADGQLEITKRPVMLTSADLIKVYDGTPLTNGDTPVKEEFGTEKAFPEGEGVTYTFKGSQTNAGSSKNTFTYAWNEGTNKDNYTIYQVEGDLVVTPIDGIKVTITGRKDTQTYDGKEHSVFGYDVTPSNALYNPKEDMQFNGTDVDMIAKGTDAGTYTIGLTAEHFTNKSNNFTNVTFVVTDGYVKITPRAVTLTSETAGKTYDSTALEKPVVTVGGDGFVEGQVKEIKATGSVTNAGSVANTITFTPDKETFKDGNYAITKNEGTLTVNKRSVLLTSQSATKTYDGSALTRPAVTITGDGFVPGELAKVEATGSITNVGSTPNAIQYTTTGAFNPANYSIALSVGTLTVTAKPEPEPRRTFNLTVNYVYQNGKRAAASYNRGGLKNGETFDITSPVIAGYTASETVVSGTIYNRDIKVTVIYTADGVNLDDYGVPLGLGNITMNVGDCFE